VEQLSEGEVGRALDVADRGSLPPVRRALLEFAEQLTLAPEEMSSENVRSAIDAGVSVDCLRDVVEIAALMNVMNRIYVTLDVSPRS
jgi:alkylhydroperoxidase family enzyme